MQSLYAKENRTGKGNSKLAVADGAYKLSWMMVDISGH